MVKKGAELHQIFYWDITIGQKYIPMPTSSTRLSLVFLRMRMTKGFLNLCFPTYGVAFPMYSGSVMCFNPLIPRGRSDPNKNGKMIFSAYVSAKK
jgi:hypothetical protein